MTDKNARERKIFIWIDEAEKIHVSIAHRTKEELEDAFDWESNERLLAELPFKLEGAEGLAGESPDNYYRAIEGLLELQGVASTIEVLLEQVAQGALSIAKHLPANNSRVQ